MSPIWEAKRGSHNLKTMRNFRFLISVTSLVVEEHLTEDTALYRLDSREYEISCRIFDPPR